MTFSKKLLPFIIIGLIHLISILFSLEILVMISKPLLMPTLLLYFIGSTPNTPLHKFINAALICTFLGDTLLMFEDSSSLFFVFGLVSFLLAQIIYIIINLNALDQPSQLKLQWQDAIFVVIGLFIFSLIKENLGSLYLPVVVYTVVICLMAMSARKRWKKVDQENFWLVFIGAMLFMLSDALIAINKFNGSFPFSRFSIMITYLAAQLMIIEGYKRFILNLGKKPASEA